MAWSPMLWDVSVSFNGSQFVANNLLTDVYVFTGFDSRPQDTYSPLGPSTKTVTTPLMPAFYEPRLVVQSKSHDGDNSTSPLAPTSYRNTQRRTKRRVLGTRSNGRKKPSTPTKYIPKATEPNTRRQRRIYVAFSSLSSTETALIEIQPPQTSKKASGT
ncbi:hypothetical protein NEUTE1DRAFT_135766 [Neurospora tetrasperma FGSC 2508]|uniref:Uncharacterized protein n=1 Tax=Neurospora tetrasperma (strain FGSC 2508 / ATCC MYA-4615 / P0657) TaxID=510951 RepID=F8MGP3_NEUT8|nr:uncharacterized protein NEUTE1DRAFT_135766 [Neurospora tetrasperma FGSC 2508]EGO58665.1 hypothetical protein NEUTE1DRAFT_135766 [Neurospora tetrasperma FGSC 2508]EGZ72750.1 hypothetical protein NEUTE2DRAFT_164955 [Neurospora tetrasperma FGSC 2509]